MNHSWLTVSENICGLYLYVEIYMYKLVNASKCIRYKLKTWQS